MDKEMLEEIIEDVVIDEKNPMEQEEEPQEVIEEGE